MKKIILINGSGGCGKSTFIKFCHLINPSVIELSTVDYVKEIAQALGWDGKKTEKDRAFLHDLKMALESWKDIPNQKVCKRIEQDSEHSFFFVNVREIENIKKLKDCYKSRNTYNVYSLLVSNPFVKQIKSNKADANVNNYTYDYYINNDGTLGNLLDKANDFMKVMEENCD